MKKILLLIIACLGCINLYAQSEAANWYFGYGAGIEFNQATNTLNALNNGQLSTNEGCASISNVNGDLLFYTDGSNVWNRNHQLMPNGSGLFGDSSSTQSAIIVPKPNDSDIYYIFTVDNNLNGVNLGLNYSEVDMTLDNGLGDITNKNINLLEECSEKISAVLKDCFTKSIWVITLSTTNGLPGTYNTYHAFEISDLGVNTTSITSTFSNLLIGNARGYLKLSPDGTKLASANTTDGLYVYDFDVATGSVSNQIELQLNGPNNRSYGVEFSPSSQLLYIHASNDFSDFNNPNPANHSSSLIQFNLAVPDIQSSAVVVDNRQLYRGGLQLAPNGKIYRALSATYSQGLPFLGVINNPDNIGIACNYQHNAVNLAPNNSSQGLPPFISSFFNTQIDIIKNELSATNLELCGNDTYTLIADEFPGATYTWSLNGNLLPENDFNLFIDQSGHYEVYIDPNDGDCTYEGEAFVIYNENPEAFNYTLIQCDEDGVFGGSTPFNLNQANDALIGGISGLSTKFYTDSARTNEIIDSNNYVYDTDNPHIIYVEVINNTTGCFSYAELTLNVSLTQINTFPYELCDELASEDGINTFDLNDYTTQIQSFNNINFPITYYKTYEDALLENEALGDTFTNSVPYSQTIFARVENANDCYGISEVVLTVYELPDIDVDELQYYCLNTFPQTITINAGIVNDSPLNYSYSWSTGENTFEIQVNDVSTYTVTVTNNTNGCTKERTVTVEASNIATFQSIEVIDATQNNIITVFVSGEGVYEYALFNDDDDLYRSFQESNTFDNVYPGIYTVQVRDIKNDCGTVPDDVSVIGFPKFFTPNNDGRHDTWQVLGISGMFQPNSFIQIFDRYGKLVKQLNPLGRGWDGLFNGQKLPADDYWFAVTLQDGRIFKNHFTLKR